MSVDPNDERGRKLIATAGNANPPSLAAWSGLVAERDWDLIVDVGANYGEMLLNLEPMPRCTIVAVEANWRVASHLSSSIVANGVPVCVLVGALGSGAGIVQLDGAEGNSGLVATRPTDLGGYGGNPMSLTCATTLDNLVRSVASKPLSSMTVCIKIDVEGNEQAVIDGASETLQKAADAVVMLEVLHSTVAIPGFRRALEVPAHSRPDLVQDAVFRRERSDP